jgi:hypothetical protein
MHGEIGAEFLVEKIFPKIHLKKAKILLQKCLFNNIFPENSKFFISTFFV